MSLNKNKKINLAFLTLFLLAFIIGLIYLNSIFGLYPQIRRKIILYQVRKASLELNKKLAARGINVNANKTNTNAKEDLKTALPTIFDNPVKGGTSAKVTIIEFSDFSCPACADAVQPLKQAEEFYGDKIRIVWKDFPLGPIHPFSQKAAEAARCADEQDSFWPYHDLLFSNQDEFSSELWSTLAKQLNLNLQKFDLCLASGKMASLIEKDYEEGLGLGIGSTPYIFINNKRIDYAPSFEELKKIIDGELLLKQ